MNETELYRTYRPLLFAVAYRCLGTATDAEDIVQETFADLTKSRGGIDVRHTKAYLCRIVANKCKDRIREIVKEREHYAGPWLPEPILTGMEERVLHRESLASAYLMLLQGLSETERHVFVLRTVGGFSYKELSGIMQKSESHCRQIFRRAKAALELRRESPHESEPLRYKALIERFVDALQNGKLDVLADVLADDVVFAADGGGKAVGAPLPITTAARVSQFLMKTSSLIPAGMRTSFVQVNGYWGLVLSAGNSILYVFTFQLRDGRIRGIYATSNPDKLVYAQKQFGGN